MTTFIFSLIIILLISNLITLFALGLFFVEFGHVVILFIQAIWDLFQANYIFYFVNADITLAFGLCLTPATSSDDGDPDKKDKTGFLFFI